MHQDTDVAVAQGPLARRYTSTIESLTAAREAYRLLRSQTAVDVRALRKAAKQVYDLEQLQAVLARELAQIRME
jgi:hypothetical protein